MNTETIKVFGEYILIPICFTIFAVVTMICAYRLDLQKKGISYLGYQRPLMQNPVKVPSIWKFFSVPAVLAILFSAWSLLVWFISAYCALHYGN